MLKNSTGTTQSMRTVALSSGGVAANALMYAVPKNRSAQVTFMKGNNSNANFRLNGVEMYAESHVTFLLAEGTTIANGNNTYPFSIIVCETDLG